MHLLTATVLVAYDTYPLGSAVRSVANYVTFAAPRLNIASLLFPHLAAKFALKANYLSDSSQ